jgi:predicted small secreted protein
MQIARAPALHDFAANRAVVRLEIIEAMCDIEQIAGGSMSIMTCNPYRRLIMTKKIIVSLVAMAFSAAFFGTLTGCNTMEGVGKDVEKGGKEIKEEAQEHKKY